MPAGLNGVTPGAYKRLDGRARSPAAGPPVQWLPTMTTAAPPPPDSVTNQKQHHAFDPDHYRMTIGEHLEELRSRLVLGLIGFAVALVACLVFSDNVVAIFCSPLLPVLRAEGQSPQLVMQAVTEGFMVYMTVALISAFALSSPWLLYQLWQFVAAGLYPHERKYVTKYLPLSIFLLVSGMAFVYFVVLPLTLSFLVHFGTGIAVPGEKPVAVTVPADVLANSPRIALLDGTPTNAPEGFMWIDRVTGRLHVFFNKKVRVLPFGSNELLRAEITLGDYVSLVIAMLISFGLAFQLPLVVLTVERIGIADVATLRASRKYVYFAIMVASAIVSPGDAITATVAMFVPLIGLYELGIWLALIGRKPATTA